eukprot:scaffold6451_cov78-Phaeocystis_antarctica.AAC.1
MHVSCVNDEARGGVCALCAVRETPSAVLGLRHSCRAYCRVATPPRNRVGMNIPPSAPGVLVGMNITRRSPQGLRPSQAGGFSLLRVPSATHSPAASHTAEQPVQRTHPPSLPTGLFHNSPARPFRAHGTVHRLPASEAISAPRPHAQALVDALAGPQRAPLRVN